MNGVCARVNPDRKDNVKCLDCFEGFLAELRIAILKLIDQSISV